MGCGCKNENSEILESSKNLKNIKYYLDNDKFSLFGSLQFLVVTPIVLLVIPPIIVTMLFKKLVFKQNVDIIKQLVLTKDKKTEK